MEGQKKISEFTLDYLVSKLCSRTDCLQQSLEMDFRSVSRGCGRDAVHESFYLRIGWDEFSDEGGFATAYKFAEHINGILKGFEDALNGKGIYIERAVCFFENGKDWRWNSTRNDEMLSAVKLVRVTPCDGFGELREWLKGKSGYDMGVLDISGASICKKRGCVSVSGCVYYCVNRGLMAEYLKSLKDTYKSGDKVSVERYTDDYFDGGYDNHRYEYEQYGERTNGLKVRMSSPNGGDERVVNLY